MAKAFRYILQGDETIFYFINSKVKCRILDFFMPLVTHLGSACFTIVFALAAMYSYWKTDRIIAVYTAISLASSHITIHFIKKAVDRPRPNITLSNVHTFNIPLYNYSFPSGHTTAAFSVAVSAAFLLPAFATIAIILASLVGFSRIYLGVHYPTDVIIGAFIGSTAAMFIKSILDYYFYTGSSVIIT
ncbi:MAG: phosphatase family protein [Bacillota bacterium]|jgi:undecaprenyl-diphosphatase|nr:phosphatase family protein [Bacillota bacterium]